MKQQKNTDTFTSTETPKQNSKILQMASDSQGDQQQNMEITPVISFTEETMQKLKIFSGKFKVQLEFKSDPIGAVVKLSNKKFTKDIFKLLNKNLNFIPTFKQGNKNFTLKWSPFSDLLN